MPVSIAVEFAFTRAQYNEARRRREQVRGSSPQLERQVWDVYVQSAQALLGVIHRLGPASGQRP